MCADLGPAVEWPDEPGRLHTQRGEGWRLLLGPRCHRGLPEQTQHAAHHPVPWVQTGRLRVLPQPKGEFWLKGQYNMPSMFPNYSFKYSQFCPPAILLSSLLYSLLPGPHFILCLKLLWCGKQPGSLCEVGSRPCALCCSVSGQQHDQGTHRQAKVRKKYRGLFSHSKGNSAEGKVIVNILFLISGSFVKQFISTNLG